MLPSGPPLSETFCIRYRVRTNFLKLSKCITCSSSAFHSVWNYSKYTFNHIFYLKKKLLRSPVTCILLIPGSVIILHSPTPGSWQNDHLLHIGKCFTVTSCPTLVLSSCPLPCPSSLLDLPHASSTLLIKVYLHLFSIFLLWLQRLLLDWVIWNSYYYSVYTFLNNSSKVCSESQTK